MVPNEPSPKVGISVAELWMIKHIEGFRAEFHPHSFPDVCHGKFLEERHVDNARTGHADTSVASWEHSLKCNEGCLARTLGAPLWPSGQAWPISQAFEK